MRARLRHRYAYPLFNHQMELLMNRRTRHIRQSAVVATAVAVVVALSGCSVGDVVRQQASSAACALITPVIDQVTKDVQAAVNASGIDPAQALVNMKAARTVLQTINGQVTDGAQAGSMQAVLDTLDQLIPLVESAANGAATGQVAIDKLQTQLSDQVTTLTKAC
ncbi:MAG: hypothetical protein KF867_03660 [Cryobacterium sp.]|nr:hypothetical protein [Cryobacterium sp.]